MQNYHMDSNGWCDIGYSFAIGGDGEVYEGRGWNHVGAHTYGFNDVGYGVDFIGDFTDHDPTQAAQDTYQVLAAVRTLIFFTHNIYECFANLCLTFSVHGLKWLRLLFL